MNMRKVTSLTALISFVLLLVTSAVLYIVPSGRVAYWAGYRLWGLSKEDWGAVHINLGVLLLAAMVLHVYYNWSALTGYMKNRAKQMRIFTVDFNISLAVTLVVFIGTLAGLPPMSSIIDFGEAVTDRANLYYGEPPYGHAELSPLKDFVDKVNEDLDESLSALRAAGLTVVSSAATMKEIAETNGTTPQKLFEIIKPKDGADLSGSEMPEEAPGGTGNRTVAQLCEIYRLDAKRILAGLDAKGIAAGADQTIKEIAAANAVDPHTVYGEIYALREK